MAPITRRTVLKSLPALAVGSAGCLGLTDGDEDALPVATTWYHRQYEVTNVVSAASGSLLVGSASPFPDDPLVTALDPETGEAEWEVLAEVKGQTSPVGVGETFAYVFTKAESLYAVDHRTGATEWQRPLNRVNAADPGVTEFAPIPVGERLVVPISGTEDDVPDRLEGFDRATGDRRFNHEFSASIAGTPAAIDGEGVVVPVLDGTLRRVGLDGTERWRADVGATPSPPTVHDGTVYVGSATEEVSALDAETGERLWTADLENTVFTRPLVADGTVHVGGADYSLRAFDAANGTERWRAETSNAVTSGPMLVDGRLVTLVGGRRRVRGPSGTIPFEPTELFVHETQGRRVARHSFDGHQNGGRVGWALAAGRNVYLGQRDSVARLSPEVFTDA